MTEIKTTFLILTIIIVSLSIMNLLIPDDNKKNTFKCICIVFIVYVFISAAFKINIKKQLNFDIKKYNIIKSQTYDIESEIIKLSENNLKNRLSTFLLSSSIKFDNLDICIEYENNRIKGINITLYNCTEKTKTKNLINSFFEENGDVNIEFC